MPKRFPDVSPDDRAVDAAGRALAGRLDAVRKYLKRSAKGENAEDIHQLRVWARRSDAAVNLYADFMSDKQRRWFRKWIKRLRKAAGKVRDSDVLARHTAGPDGQTPIQLRSDRRRGLRKIHKLAGRLDNAWRFKRRTRRLLRGMARRHADSTERFGDRARSALRPLAEAFFTASPAEPADDAALHRFRIRGKELRYAMELLAAGFAPAFRDELYPPIAELQERLGRVNDLVTACRRLEEWLANTGDPATVSHWQRRLAEVREELVLAKREFHRWWGPGLRDGLRARFAGFTADPLGPPLNVGDLHTDPCAR
jgi:CHAD domain-containing protein